MVADYVTVTEKAPGVYLGNMHEGERAMPYTRDAGGTWRSAVDRAPAEPRVQELLEWAAALAGERNVPELAVSRSEHGPEVDLSASLRAPKLSLAGGEERVPRRPGLYAIYGDATTWQAMGLGEQPDDRPLYVGKAEDSLRGRDIGTHFGDGRTGQSTVRRSVAALLRKPLSLHAMPRNPEKPGYFPNYGLSKDDDKKLTSWMREHLKLATWAPEKLVGDLGRVEIRVITAWKPPLNLTDVVTEWTVQVKAARKVMADEARVWAESHPPA